MLCVINNTFEQKDNDNVVDAEKYKTNTWFFFLLHNWESHFQLHLYAEAKKWGIMSFRKILNFGSKKMIQIKFLFFFFFFFLSSVQQRVTLTADQLKRTFLSILCVPVHNSQIVAKPPIYFLSCNIARLYPEALSSVREISLNLGQSFKLDHL